MIGDPIVSASPALAVLVPVVAGLAIPLIKLLGGGRRLIEALSITSMLLSLFFSGYVLVLARSYIIVYMFGGWPPPVGIFYEVDMLGALLGFLTGLVMVLVAMYSAGYMRDDDRLYLYYTLLLILEAGMLGCFYTGDFFNLFVMIEVTSIAAYILVAYHRDDPIASASSLKYAVYGALATTVFFAATITGYGCFGTLNMADMSAKLQGISSTITGGGWGSLLIGAAVFMALSLYAFTFKSAIFPNHYWLPDAHSSAPTPVSAVLSGLVVNVGVYCTARFLYTVLYGAPDLQLVFRYALLVLGGVSALLGGLLMNVQRDVKRLIAYSTILNIGFIVIGLSLGTPSGSAAAFYQVVAHSVAKAMLFLSIGIPIAVAGSRNIERLRGVGRKYPLVGVLVSIPLLALAGLPPLAVFMSEYSLMTAMIGCGAWAALGLFLAGYISGMIAYIRLFYKICLEEPAQHDLGRARMGGAVVLALMILGIAVVLLGIAAPPLWSGVFAKLGAGLIDPHQYVAAYYRYSSLLGRG